MTSNSMTHKVIRSLLLSVAASLSIAPALLSAQGLDPAQLTKPATDSWPTYAGDYTQQRFSQL